MIFVLVFDSVKIRRPPVGAHQRVPGAGGQRSVCEGRREVGAGGPGHGAIPQLFPPCFLITFPFSRHGDRGSVACCIAVCAGHSAASPRPLLCLRFRGSGSGIAECGGDVDQTTRALMPPRCANPSWHLFLRCGATHSARPARPSQHALFSRALAVLLNPKP